MDLVVYTRAEQMVSAPEVGPKQSEQRGFEMELDTYLDMVASSGFRPCIYKGQPAGFEYYYSGIEDDLKAQERSILGSRDVSVLFCTSSDLREAMCAAIAAGVLCSLADGVLCDSQSGEFIRSDEAIEWARKLESKLEAELL